MKWPSNIPTIPKWILVLALGCILFLPFLGNAHLFDWDELNFAESAREMLVTGNWLQVTIDYQPFYEKPPFFIWMQALSMKVWGVNEFAARFPNAIVGIITLLVLFRIGKKLRNETFGLIWVLVYVSCFLPHFYFKSALIDPTFNLFIFLGVYFATILTENHEFLDKKKRKKTRNRAVVLSAISIGLATLTKGPVGLLLFGLTYAVYFVMSRFTRINSLQELFKFTTVFVLVISVWYGLNAWFYGLEFIKSFTMRQIELFTNSSDQDNSHGGFMGYHLVVLLLGCFPASVFMFGGIKNHSFSTQLLKKFQHWMLALLLVVVVVFEIVQTKIPHYSSLAYFPITFFASYFFYYLFKGHRQWKWYHAVMFMVVGTIWGVAIALVPIIGKNPELITELITINDPFALGNLQAIVYWSNWEAFWGLGYIVALIAASVFFTLGHKRVGVSTLLLSTCILIVVTLSTFVPRVERYTQNAAIEFFKSKKTEDCHIESWKLRTYAQYFYAEKMPTEKPVSKLDLLTKEFDKPVYFVVRTPNHNEFLTKYPAFYVLYEKNGFVFLKKTPN